MIDWYLIVKLGLPFSISGKLGHGLPAAAVRAFEHNLPMVVAVLVFIKARGRAHNGDACSGVLLQSTVQLMAGTNGGRFGFVAAGKPR